MFGSAITHDLSRLVALPYDRWYHQSIVPDTITFEEVSGVQVAESYDLSYDRSLMATTSRTISYDGSCHRSTPTLKARPRVRPIVR